MTINLTINRSSSNEININAVEKSHTINGETFYLPGYFTQTIKNISGCDSTLYINLKFLEMTVFNKAVDDAKYLINNSLVGDSQGEYPQEAYDNLFVSLTNAESAKQDQSVNQTIIDSVSNSLNSEIDTFKSKMIPITNIVYVTEIRITEPSQNLTEGQDFVFHAIINPENATNKKLKWILRKQESLESDSLISESVFSECSFKASEAGIFYLYAYSDDYVVVNKQKVYFHDSVMIDVKGKIEISSLVPNTTRVIKIYKGSTDYSASVNVLPEDVSNKTVNWFTGNNKIALVDNKTGAITAISEGNVIIEAVSEENPLVKTTFDIQVIPLPTDKTKLENVIANASFIIETTDEDELGYNAGQFSESLFEKLKTELTNSVSVYESSISSQNEVDSITNVLAEAINLFTNSEIQPVLADSVVINSQNIVLNSLQNPILLNAVVYPLNTSNKSLTWTSSDIKVATVENGIVTMKGSGICIITATTKDGSNKSDNCEVKAIIPVTSLTIQQNIGLIEGQKTTIHATVSPANASDKSLIWTSSDVSIVEVDQTGNVTAKKQGTAKIIVKSSDGSASSICVVNVSANTIKLENILLPDTVRVIAGESQKIEISMIPFNTTDNTIYWKSSNISNLIVNYKGEAIALNPDTVKVFAFNSDKTVIDSTIVVISNSGAPSINSIENIVVEKGSEEIRIPLVDIVSDDKTNLFNLTVEIYEDADFAVSLVNDTILVVPNNPEEAASTKIVVVIRDQDNQSSIAIIPVAVSLEENKSPKIDSIPEKVVISGSSFVPLMLTPYVTDDYTKPILIEWTAFSGKNVKVSVQYNTLYATLSQSSWIGTDTVKVIATDEKGLKDSVNVLFTVSVKENEAPFIYQIPRQEQTEDFPFTAIDLSKFVKDDYTPQEFIKWEVRGFSSKIEVKIKNNKAFVKVIDLNWVGAEIITFRAIDQGGLFSDTDVIFNQEIPVVNNTWNGAPEVSFVADRTLIGVDESVTFRSSITGVASLGQLWKFEGADLEETNNPNPTIKYSVPGKFNVSFSAQNEIGVSTTTSENYINVVGISMFDTTVCVNEPLNISVSDTELTKFKWSNGESTPEISVNPSSDTKYSITAYYGLYKFIDTVTVNVSKPVFLGNDTAICQGNEITFKPEGYVSYVWNNQSPTNIPTYTVSTAQKIILETTDEYNCVSNDTVEVSVNPLPILVLGVDESICPGESIIFKATKGLSSYLWSDGSDKDSIEVKEKGKYSVTVTDSNGCNSSDEVNLVVFQPYPEKIGVVTVLEDNRIVIAWNRTSGKNTSYYKVFRETDKADVFEEIGTKAFSDPSYIVDDEANPLEQTYRYKLQTTDICQTSVMSEVHKTILLQAVYSKSTGANNLSWNAYEGIELSTYNIYRNGESTPIKSIAASAGNNMYAFNDVTGMEGDSYTIGYALKEKVTTTLIKSVSGPFSQSMSNLAESSISNLHEHEDISIVNVYPIPTRDILIVTNDGLSDLSVRILNSLGQTLFFKTGKSKIEIDCSDLTAGVYFVNFSM